MTVPNHTDLVTVGYLEQALDAQAQTIGEILFVALKTAKIKPAQLDQITFVLRDLDEATRNRKVGYVTIGDSCLTSLFAGWLKGLTT